MDKVTLRHGKIDNISCEVYIYGATLTSWKVGADEFIFVSSKAKLDGTKAIRGGIPICFPAFGPWELGPQHGFARSSNEWQLTQSPTVDPKRGDCTVVLELKDSDQTRKIWNKRFTLRYTITLCQDNLQLGAAIENPGNETLEAHFCFHTYVRVPDVTQCKLDSFKGVTFIDKTKEGFPTAVEERESLTVGEFVDRVYKEAPNVCFLSGLDAGKTLSFEKTSNLSDYVVWNPWNVSKLADMGDEDYKVMLCVEAAAFTDAIKIPARDTWNGLHTIKVLDQSFSMY